MNRITRNWNTTKAIVRTSGRAAAATSRVAVSGTADLTSRVTGQRRHIKRSQELNSELNEALDRLEDSIRVLQAENDMLRHQLHQALEQAQQSRSAST